MNDSNLKDQPLPEYSTTREFKSDYNGYLNCFNEFSKKKKKRFGSLAYETGTLPPRPDYYPSDPLGLPAGVKPVTSINQTLPDPYSQGARLPSPYDRLDNARMTLPYLVSGFSKKKSKKTKKKSKKISKKASKASLKKLINEELSKALTRKMSQNFGNTPGSDSWLAELSQRTYLPQTTETYTAAKGYPPANPVYFYTNSRPMEYLQNVPMQYRDNYLNSPYNYGSEPKAPQKKRRFGSFSQSSSMTGPNVVGHETPIPEYHAGSTTYNFATKELYSPIGLVGGPTNSTGTYSSMGTFKEPVLNVLPDSQTPNGYIQTGSVSSLNGTTNNLLKNGLGFGKSSSKDKKNNFGLVYGPELVTYGTGLLQLYQPEPPNLQNRSDINPAFGSSRPRLTNRTKPEGKTLTTKFKGSDIILYPNGKVVVK